MSPPTDPITALFPYPTLLPLHEANSEPSYASIHQVQRQLNANATSVHSHGGDGQLGLLALTVAPATYTALSQNNIPFVAPVNPPAQPVHPEGSTAAQISEINRQHTENARIFRTYHNVDAALRNQLIAAVDDAYICSLSNATIGYGNTSVLALLTHLYDTYGQISASALDDNDTRMTTAWHPPTPIEKLWKQIDDGVSYATAGNDPPTATKIVRIAYNIVAATGRFEVACREWRNREEATKTWENLKAHFKRADRDLRLTATTGTAGYHGAANHAAATSDSAHDTIANFALLATASNDHISVLTEAHAQDRATLHACQAKLASLSTAGTTASTATPQQSPRINKHYCWTHGGFVSKTHTSANCKHPCEGHKTEATADNMLGGNTRGTRRPDS
jgi:hypothetical protein